MQQPVQITFRHMEPSNAVEDVIKEKVAKLEQCYEKITSCRVVVEAPHSHKHQGNLFRVSIDLGVPDKEIIVSREQHNNHSHENAYVAVRDAFDAAKKQLKGYVGQRRKNRYMRKPAIEQNEVEMAV